FEVDVGIAADVLPRRGLVIVDAGILLGVRRRRLLRRRRLPGKALLQHLALIGVERLLDEVAGGVERKGVLLEADVERAGVTMDGGEGPRLVESDLRHPISPRPS